MHRAVGKDFVLNVNDVLYFTGLVHEFAKFANDHCLEVMTDEVDITRSTPQDIEEQSTRVECRRSTLILNEKELKLQAIHKLTGNVVFSLRVVS